MPEHGEHDPASNKWFCGYWMSREEWDDVHDYAPPTAGPVEQAEEQEEGQHKIYKPLPIPHCVVDERSAGAVVFIAGAVPEYLLLHYTAGHWDFPKGNIEAGETEKQAAIREIREETGITDIEFVDGFRHIISYRYRKGKRLVNKEVVLFLGLTKTKDVTISHEHIGFAWKSYDDAMKQLTFKNARNLLAAAKQFILPST